MEKISEITTNEKPALEYSGKQFELPDMVEHPDLADSKREVNKVLKEIRENIDRIYNEGEPAGDSLGGSDQTFSKTYAGSFSLTSEEKEKLIQRPNNHDGLSQKKTEKVLAEEISQVKTTNLVPFRFGQILRALPGINLISH
jgi:hypothetical protein